MYQGRTRTDPDLRINPNNPNILIRVIRMSQGIWIASNSDHSDVTPRFVSPGGFSLIELLLSIALIALLSGLASPVFLRLQTKNDLDLAVVSLAQSLRRAQIQSQAVDGDTTWGVKIQTGSLTLFKGTSFAGRDTTYDEITDLNSSITLSGPTEIVFAKFTGLPQTTGTLTMGSGSDSITLNVNEKGIVTY